MTLFKDWPDQGIDDWNKGERHKCGGEAKPIFKVTLEDKKVVWALFYEIAFVKVVDGEIDEEIHRGSMRVQFCPWCAQDLLFTPDQAKEFHERLKRQAPSVSVLPEGSEIPEWEIPEIKVRVGTASGRSSVFIHAANHLRKPR